MVTQLFSDDDLVNFLMWQFSIKEDLAKLLLTNMKRTIKFQLDIDEWSDEEC